MSLWLNPNIYDLDMFRDPTRADKNMYGLSPGEIDDPSWDFPDQKVQERLIMLHPPFHKEDQETWEEFRNNWWHGGRSKYLMSNSLIVC
jgi:hypothetical protein